MWSGKSLKAGGHDLREFRPEPVCWIGHSHRNDEIVGIVPQFLVFGRSTSIPRAGEVWTSRLLGVVF